MPSRPVSKIGPEFVGGDRYRRASLNGNLGEGIARFDAELRAAEIGVWKVHIIFFRIPPEPIDKAEKRGKGPDRPAMLLSATGTNCGLSVPFMHDRYAFTPWSADRRIDCFLPRWTTEIDETWWKSQNRHQDFLIWIGDETFGAAPSSIMPIDFPKVS